MSEAPIVVSLPTADRRTSYSFYREGLGFAAVGEPAEDGVQVAPLAAQNKVLFISGPAATDGVTGANKYTFRSGRQSYQDVLTAKSFIGDAAGKRWSCSLRTVPSARPTRPRSRRSSAQPEPP